MNADVDKAVKDVLADFNLDIAQIKEKFSDLLAELTTEIEAAGSEVMDDFFMDMIDDAMGEVAARAANQFEDESMQEEAISAVENWFSSNVSGQGVEAGVLCSIWHQVPELAAAQIREELANANKPSTP